jgi:hypothetical protein
MVSGRNRNDDIRVVGSLKGYRRAVNRNEQGKRSGHRKYASKRSHGTTCRGCAAAARHLARTGAIHEIH